MTWRRFDWLLLTTMLLLWLAATLRSLIGSTTFIGHVSMLALVLAALSTLRSDSPNGDE